MKAKPEVISTPPAPGDEGAPVETAAPSPKPAAAAPAVSSDADEDAGATFAHTRQHVADRKQQPEGFQRFANTRHNIALINDPKNGPRFTLTKKESGLVEKPVAASTPATDETTTPADARQAADAPKTETAAGAPAAASGTGTAKAAPPAAGPIRMPPAADPPSKVPVDSSKTFVGPNGTYYDEAWRWMDWRGTRRSWNWPAALTFGHWFAYRRLYWHAVAFACWLTTLAAAAVNNLHAGLVAGLVLSTLALAGLYGNTLYFLVFRRAVAHVTEQGEGSYDELKEQLAKAGGVSPTAPWIMAVLTVVGIGLALAATHYERGGFAVNLWPF